MSHSRRLPIVGVAYSSHATVTTSDHATDRCIEVVLDDGRRVSACGPDFFDALLSVRQKLEAMSLTLCCQGARRDVWPSGMARQMASGLKAYVLVQGRPATTDDLVDILDSAEPDAVVTVADQMAYRDLWFERR